MSKKLASGSDCILLDVKCGSGAFMKDEEHAKMLARAMVDIGKELGKDVKAEVTNMDQPLGCAVGNSLEIKEVIDTLKGKGPKDITEICISSGSIMLVQAKLCATIDEARKKLEENIKNGKAFEKFREFVIAQGGDVSYVDEPSKFPVSKHLIEIKSTTEGYVKRIDALTIGKGSMMLGGGRETLDDVIDMSAGIILNKKIGDYVKQGELLATLHTNKEDYKEVVENVTKAFEFSKEAIETTSNLTHGLIE